MVESNYTTDDDDRNARYDQNSDVKIITVISYAKIFKKKKELQ